MHVNQILNRNFTDLFSTSFTSKLELKLDKIVQKVHFVPEQKTVESLLEFLKRSRTDTAVVVDEYGGIAGSVRLGDIAEELFGQMEPAIADGGTVLPNNFNVISTCLFSFFFRS